MIRVVAAASMRPLSTQALGRSEMRRLATPYEGPWPDSLVLFDEPADVWCPAAGPLVDRARAGGTAVVVAAQTPHAFATRAESRERVLGLVADAVEGRLSRR